MLCYDLYLSDKSAVLTCVLKAEQWVTESGEESVFELKKMEEEVIEEENDFFSQAVKECFMNEESKASSAFLCLQEKLQMKCAPKEDQTTEEEKE
ncbi:hypothetical protein CDAR_320082 [Caerostris darwini]|uniref:Uncharacterized protein n=1 Tax=Caerostris darwini TaxID=1538125 RepID=A0AAV4QTC8_9ARAC|nr:hypothetical protein CDAR_320082 [Caerostris darwini]